VRGASGLATEDGRGGTQDDVFRHGVEEHDELPGLKQQYVQTRHAPGAAQGQASGLISGMCEGRPMSRTDPHMSAMIFNS
jgi:hypothetical protein